MTDENSSGNGSYEVINPPNKLKAKVGLGTGIDPKLLARAQSLVDGMSGEFEERAAEEATHILRLVEAVKAASNAAEAADVTEVIQAEKEDAESQVVDIFRIGHELKGQGGTFGYPLISRIGGSLCRYIEAVPDKETVDLEVLRAHAEALRAVAANKVAGDGGAIEKQILDSLELLVQQALN